MPTITIKKRDTTTATVLAPHGVLGLVSSGTVKLSPADTLVAITIDDNLMDRDYQYQALMASILNHEGDVFSLVGENDGYYVSRINGVTPLNGGIALLGGISERIYENGNTIHVKNIARADLDCDDYIRIKEYILRIKNTLDGIKSQIVDDPETGIGGALITYGVHRQYQTLQRIWNYLVRNLSLVLNVSYQENAEDTSDVYMQIKIHNNTGQTYTLRPMNITLHRRVQWSNVYIRQEKVVKISRTSGGARIAVSVTPPGPGNISIGSSTAAPDTVTWTYTPWASGSYPDGPVDVQPNETIAISIQFKLFVTTGSASLPHQLSFTVATDIKDDTVEGDEVVTVSRGRTVYIHNESLTYTAPEE